MCGTTRTCSYALLAALTLACGSAQGNEGVSTASASVSDTGATSSSQSTTGESSEGATTSGATDSTSTSADSTGESEEGETGDEGTLSERYPDDDGIGDDPAVLFHDNFEGGWGKWDAPVDNTAYLTLESDAAMANAGDRYLRSTVTTADLVAQEYISASPRVRFDEQVDTIYWRFHTRMPNVAANPHHWIRMSAGDENWNSSGQANMVPPGDAGFWFDFDITNANVFNFYVYWHEMRSGRCNDGSATPGCDGDQGTTYHYGNTFQPPAQSEFPRDEWFCIELASKANTVGASDGELEFWIDDLPVGKFAPGEPEGTWLRDTFHPGGCEFSACTDPAPFEGFDFRTAPDVQFKEIFLDAYYERGSAANKKAALEAMGLTVSDEQTILYDDVVVATERIGCRK